MKRAGNSGLANMFPRGVWEQERSSDSIETVFRPPFLYFGPNIATYNMLCMVIFVLVLRLVDPNRKTDFFTQLE